MTFETIKIARDERGVATITLARAGIRHFWSTGGRSAPRLKAVEVASILAPILACVALTAFAEPVLRYTDAAAFALHSPRPYVDKVLLTRPRPGPMRPVHQEGSP